METVTNTLIEVESSNIKAVEYYKDSKVLQVQFIKGGTYYYYKVPIRIYKELLGASSKGKFLYKNIAYKYEYKKLSR